MSEIYKKKITTTIDVDYIKCDKCGIETQFILAIDVWAIVNNENYCYNCQHEYKVSFGEKRIKL